MWFWAIWSGKPAPPPSPPPGNRKHSCLSWCLQTITPLFSTVRSTPQFFPSPENQHLEKNKINTISKIYNSKRVSQQDRRIYKKYQEPAEKKLQTNHNHSRDLGEVSTAANSHTTKLSSNLVTQKRQAPGVPSLPHEGPSYSRKNINILQKKYTYDQLSNYPLSNKRETMESIKKDSVSNDRHLYTQSRTLEKVTPPIYRSPAGATNPNAAGGKHQPHHVSQLSKHSGTTMSQTQSNFYRTDLQFSKRDPQKSITHPIELSGKVSSNTSALNSNRAPLHPPGQEKLKTGKS